MVVTTLAAEFRKVKALADAAIAQLADDQLHARLDAEANSVAMLMQHLAGNMQSRWTDFLTSDGEKPWRNREEEFDARSVSRSELLAKWEDGWSALLGALSQLSDEHLEREVTIRGQALSVTEALHRSLAHTSYHVGQIVYLAKEKAGGRWTSLSIPKGKSADFNLNPSGQRPGEHVEQLEKN
jgi:uncharacterized damage-inducible protein DinB